MPTTALSIAVGQTRTLLASWTDSAGNTLVLHGEMSVLWYKDSANANLYLESGDLLPISASALKAGTKVLIRGISVGACNVQASPADPDLQHWIIMNVSVVGAAPTDGTITVSA